MFCHKHRVRYYETDKMGVAHHSSFIYWFENARVEFLRHLGVNYRDIEDAGYNLAVVEVSGRFLKPVFYDELISVFVKVSKFDGRYARFEYIVKNEKDEVVVKGYTKHFVVGRDLKQAKLPDIFIKKIQGNLPKSE